MFSINGNGRGKGNWNSVLKTVNGNGNQTANNSTKEKIDIFHCKLKGKASFYDYKLHYIPSDNSVTKGLKQKNGPGWNMKKNQSRV